MRLQTWKHRILAAGVADIHELVGDTAATNHDENQDETVQLHPDPSATQVTLPTVNEWCVVSYEGKCYIGNVVDKDEEDEEIQVSTLECVGGNRFKNPRFKDDLGQERTFREICLSSYSCYTQNFLCE